MKEKGNSEKRESSQQGYAPLSMLQFRGEMVVEKENPHIRVYVPLNIEMQFMLRCQQSVITPNKMITLTLYSISHPEEFKGVL